MGKFRRTAGVSKIPPLAIIEVRK